MMTGIVTHANETEYTMKAHLENSLVEIGWFILECITQKMQNPFAIDRKVEGTDRRIYFNEIEPSLTEAALNAGYTNEAGYGDTVRLSQPTVGFWILQECRRYWAERGEDLDLDMMMHLAGVSDPFECLINPAATMFQTPGDMPQKIKAFCRESGQPIPRKPGPVIRCVLESIALYYRKAMQELEMVTGRKMSRLYLLPGKGGAKRPLFNNFIANALQIPVVLCPPETTATGIVIVQAIALKHIESLEAGRKLANQVLRCETAQPYAGVWDKAFHRLEQLTQ